MKKRETAEQATFDTSNYFLEWAPKKPIKILPQNIKGYFKEEASYLFISLSQNKLHKVLIPAPEPRFEGHMVRTYSGYNPEWYSELYRSYEYSDKKWSNSLRSYIRRDRSLKALDRIKNEKDKQFIENVFKQFNWIDKVYRELIYDRLTEGYNDLGFYVPGINEVRIFFGLEPLEEDLQEKIRKRDLQERLKDIPF